MEDANAGVNLNLTAQIVSAYIANNPVPDKELPALIRSVHTTLGDIDKGEVSKLTSHPPAVPIKKSIHPEYVVCLEDGKKLKMLKRYLRSRYGLSPDDYRTKWGLPADYPMVAPNYAQQRSDFAKKIGLGRTAPTPAKKARK